MTEWLQTMSEDFSRRRDWAESTTELLRAPQHPASQSTAIEGLEHRSKLEFLGSGEFAEKANRKDSGAKEFGGALGAIGTTEG